MQFKVDMLSVEIFSNREFAGRQAGADVANAIKKVLENKDEVNIILGSAPSQLDLYAGLLEQKDIPWEKINAFHMDEYIGISKDAPQGFGVYLNDHLFRHVNCKSINLINTETDDLDNEIKRYSKLLDTYKADIVCIGIGENGHIAFNDPPADFSDRKLVKKVEVALAARQQQVNDGQFDTLEQVPMYALTLTIPALVNCSNLFCIVPASSKADAVRKTLEQPISEDCPASIIRRHHNCKLYLEPDSAADLAKS